MLIDPCKHCGVRCDPVTKRGSELNPNAIYGAAEAYYTLCSNCNYRLGWTI